VTYTLTPADALDPLVLAALALSTVSSVIVPICEPYPYIPYDPAVIQADPSAEQTTSILGFISYAFQDSVISAAYRTGHLEPEMLPPQLDSDDLAALKPSAYPYLSPFYGGGRRRVRVLWGLLSVFRGRWVTQAALLALDAFLQLGAPIGTNQLLAHVEARGAGKLVRPGVWIAWIALAPLAGALVQQMQMYVNQRTLVRLEALLTALVHEHALRVRVVHAPDEVPVAPAQGRLDSRATDTTALSASPAPAKATKTPAGVPERVKSQDIMARLTTLVTADLANISGGGRFLYSFIQTPLSIALASVFLVSVIGSAAWVGFAVMLMLMPVPAWTGKLLKGVQKKAMTATDARVKAVKEALGVLRMVKIMGFESEVQRQIQVLRDEELRYLFWRRIYNLVNICVKCVDPLRPGGRIG
jgi:ABC-type multidrug transport system fused ATPase/permease subunit